PVDALSRTAVLMGRAPRQANPALRVGTRVAVDPSLYCHECHYCRLGHNNLCERWNAIGVSVPGGAAQLAAAPAAHCVALPDHPRVEDAALIEPLSCAARR